MPPPPPPPPPGPPPPPAPPGGPAAPKFKAPPPGKAVNRGALLSEIQNGPKAVKLKKVTTVDKSAPMIAVAKPAAPASSDSGSGPSSIGGGGGGGFPMGGPVGLGGLFAGGMPKLRSTGNRPTASQKNAESAPVSSPRDDPAPHAPPADKPAPHVPPADRPAPVIAASKPNFAPKPAPPSKTSNGSVASLANVLASQLGGMGGRPAPAPSKLPPPPQSVKPSFPAEPLVQPLIPAAAPATSHNSGPPPFIPQVPQVPQPNRMPKTSAPPPPPPNRPPSGSFTNGPVHDQRPLPAIPVAGRGPPPPPPSRMAAPRPPGRPPGPPPSRPAVPGPPSARPPPPPPMRSSSMATSAGPPIPPAPHRASISAIQPVAPPPPVRNSWMEPSKSNFVNDFESQFTFSTDLPSVDQFTYSAKSYPSKNNKTQAQARRQAPAPPPPPPN